MTDQNHFAALLEHELFAVDTHPSRARIKPGYRPQPKLLARLTGDHPDLIPFLNTFNPFQDTLRALYHHVTPEELRLLRRAFPLAASVVAKLDEENSDLVFNLWKDGIAQTVMAHRDQLVGPYGLHVSGEDLAYVFAEPVASLTREGPVRRFFPTSFLLSVCLRAARVTDDMNDSAQQVVRTHFFDLIKKQQYTEHDLSVYKELTYKPLDEVVVQAFRSADFGDATTVFASARAYLDFIEMSKTDFLAEAHRLIPLFLQELQEAYDAFRRTQDHAKDSFDVRRVFDLKQTLLRAALQELAQL